MKPTRRGVALVLLSVQLAACSRWEIRPGSIRDALAEMDDSTVRLTDTRGNQIVGRVAEIRGDSVYGTLGTSGPEACFEASSFCTLNVPVSSVGLVEERSFSLMRTVALVIVPLGAIMVAVANQGD